MSNNDGGKLVRLTTGEQIAIENGTERITLSVNLTNGGLLTKEYMFGFCVNPPVLMQLIVKETTTYEGKQEEQIVYKAAYNPEMVARLMGCAEEIRIK